MKLGISTYTYTWAFGVPGFPPPSEPMTLSELLMIAHQHGIGVVQLCDNVPLHLKNREELAALAQQAADLGIEIEVGTRGVSEAHLLAYLDIAQIFNASLLRTILLEDGKHVDIATAQREITKVLPRFVDAGVRLAVENHEKHKCSELIQLVQALDSDYVGICMDTVNSLGALEAPNTVIKALAPYTLNLHIKGFKIERLSHQMGFIVTGTPAGEGDLDIPFALAEVGKYRQDINVILELWTPYTETIDQTVEIQKQWAEISLNNLKEVLQ